MRLIALTGTLLLCATTPAAYGADWQPLFNGRDLTGWEKIGNGVWTILPDRTLVGQRNYGQPSFRNGTITEQGYREWVTLQSWLYTVRDYEEFDLELEYWLRTHGNSGISIRDPSRARFAVTSPVDFRRTPSKLGYEIQLNNQYPDPSPSGTIYTFAKAATGAQVDDQWNKIRIESRKSSIRVFLNEKLVAEHTGDPARPARGPIGLQLHDQFSVVMFRNIRIRER